MCLTPYPPPSICDTLSWQLYQTNALEINRDKNMEANHIMNTNVSHPTSVDLSFWFCTYSYGLHLLSTIEGALTHSHCVLEPLTPNLTPCHSALNFGYRYFKNQTNQKRGCLKMLISLPIFKSAHVAFSVLREVVLGILKAKSRYSDHRIYSLHL